MLGIAHRSSSIHLLYHLLLVFCFVAFTIQVDITFRVSVNGIVISCEDQPPGICCRVPETMIYYGTYAFTATTVLFDRLLVGDIAASFPTRSGVGDAFESMQSFTGCSTRIVGTGHGPGRWESRIDMDPGFGGASYISVPTFSGSIDQKTANMLTMQGILGLVWGGGKWFASDAAANALNRMIAGGSTTLPKSKRRISSELKGTVYAQGPSSWVYPSMVEVNGTKYTGGVGNLMYTSIDGRVLNLTSPSST